MNVDEKAVDALYNVCEGDVRRMVNMLQSCAALDKKIEDSVVYEIAGAVRPKEVKDVLEMALKGDFLRAREKLLDVMLAHGMGGLDTVKQIQKEIWGLGINDLEKVRLIEKCGEIEFRMVEGSDDFVQLEALLSSFVLVKK